MTLNHAIREPAIDSARQPQVGSRYAPWAEALGPRWWAFLALFAALAFTLASLVPLDDIDLPMHLSVGEWIVRHHAFPVTEPFAWTRPGDPYFAYSWLVQVSAYGLLAALGPLGPHLLHGLVVAAAVTAVVLFGRLEGWRPWTTLLTAVAHFGVLTPSLRPQGALFALVPLAWAAASWLRRSEGELEPSLALFAVSAVTANVHVLLPLTAAPVFVLAVDPPAERRRVLYAAVAVVAGWLCSPYGLMWPAVFRLNFAPNPLFRFPSPIVEYQPGFIVSPWLGAAMATLPWLSLSGRRLGRRELALGLLWLLGLVGFARAEKAIIIWWLVSLPLVGAALARVPDPRSPRRARARAWILAGVGLLLCAEHLVLGRATRAREGTVTSRTLPGGWATQAEPVAAWLDTHARPTRRAHLLTTFNYGSYLTWRLPAYSESIDSRTIFPDSVAKAEEVIARPLAGVAFGPWRSADVAIVPQRFAVAGVLDTASGWIRLPVDSGRGRPRALGLWARRAWWDSSRVRGDAR